MKKQNQNNKLVFRKNSVTELNDNDLNNVNGGTSSLCITISVVFTAGVVKGFFEELNN